MRPWMLLVIAVLLGGALGVGATAIEFGGTPLGELRSQLAVGIAPEDAPPNAPRAFTEQEEFDFGTMERDTGMSHVFTIRNNGVDPLVLNDGGVSCMKCTEFSIEKSPIKRDETAKIEVRWKAVAGLGPFRQTATVLTNDPVRPSIVFTVTGTVVSSHRVDPEELVFSSITPNGSATADLRVYTYKQEHLDVSKFEFARPEAAENFEVKVEPMPAEMVAEEPEAKSGAIVQVKVKPGLPVGPVRETLRLHLDMPSNPVIEVPIVGSVTSEVQLVGPRWDSDKGVLTLGMVKRSVGDKAQLFLQARGSERGTLKPKVLKASPESLKVTVGEVVEMAGGNLIRVPLTIEVPPNSRPSIHLGGPQGELGEILIDTGHPEAKELRIRVRFAVGD